MYIIIVKIMKQFSKDMKIVINVFLLISGLHIKITR